MKILDRYIYSSLLLSTFICVATVMGFYIIIDLFGNFHRFVRFVDAQVEHGGEYQSLLLFIFWYFLYLSPLMLYTLMPMMVLMVSMFVITKMERAKELTLLKSAGISTYRVLRPFFLYTTIVSLLMFSLQEVLIPSIGQEIIFFSQMNEADKVVKAVQYHDERHQMFYMGLFWPQTNNASEIRISQLYDNSLRHKKVIEAENGKWEEHNDEEILTVWDGKISYYSPSGDILPVVHKFRDEDFLHVAEFMAQLQRGTDSISQHIWNELPAAVRKKFQETKAKDSLPVELQQKITATFNRLVETPSLHNYWAASTMYEKNIEQWITQLEGEYLWRYHRLLLERTYSKYIAKGAKYQNIDAAGHVVQTELKPHDLVVQGEENLEVLSLWDLRYLAQKNPKAANFKVAFYSRFSLPLGNFCLLLIGLSVFLSRGVQNFFFGAGICLICFGAFYFLNVLCLNLGHRGYLHPLFAAALPLVVFGSLGIALTVPFTNVIKT